MDKDNESKNTYEMTEEELWEEEIYYKLDTHEYVCVDGKIYDYESGDLVCLLSEVDLGNN